MKKLLATVSAVALMLAMVALPATAAAADEPAPTETAATETISSEPAPTDPLTTDSTDEPVETEPIDTTLTEPIEPSNLRVAPQVASSAPQKDEEPSTDKCTAGYLKPAPLDASSGNYTLMDGSTVIGTLVWSGTTTVYDLEDGWTLDLCVKSGSKSNPDGSSNKVTYFTGLTGQGSATILQEISHLEYKASYTPPEDPDCDDLTGGRGFSVSIDTECPEDPTPVTAGSETLTDQVCEPSGDETPGDLVGGSIRLTLSDYTGIASITYQHDNGTPVDVTVTGNVIDLEDLDPGKYDFVVTAKPGFTLADGEFSETISEDKSQDCVKVQLCHWTQGSDWNVLNISQSAAQEQGHLLDEPSDHKWDIIPPFAGYEGKNWDATSDNSPEAFGSYPFNGQQGSQIFPDCETPDEPEPEQVSVVHGSDDEQCDLFDETQVVGGSITLQVYVGGSPVTLPNAAVTITVKGPGDLAYGPLPDLSDLPDGLYEFLVVVADGYDLTGPATFSETIANKDAEDCDLTTLGPIVPQVTFTDPTCFVDGSFTLVSPAPEEGLPAKTVTWFVNGVETEAGTHPVTSPASVVVKAVASPGYTFEDFVTEITYPAHEFAVDETCDLTTLALTGQEQPSPLLLVAGFLGLLGVALARAGVRVARRTAD